MTTKRPLSAEQARAKIRNRVTGKLGVSNQRMNQLLKAGRIRGAYQVNRCWLIPEPVIVEGAK